MSKHSIKILVNTEIAAIAGGEVTNNHFDLSASPTLFSTMNIDTSIGPPIYFPTGIKNDIPVIVPYSLVQISNFTLLIN